MNSLAFPPRKSSVAFAAMFILLALAPAAADCTADLATTDRSFKETMERLEKVANGAPAEQCAAYRGHVAVMTRARAVFMRCTSGLAQRENVGQMNDSLEDFAELIKRRCTP